MAQETQSIKPLPTEEEKTMLRSKLAELAKLEQQKREIAEKKKQIKQETVPLKSKLHVQLKQGPKRVQWEQCLVERVYKKQQRRPTLQMTYEAIRNVLGEQGVAEVKAAVELLKKEHLTSQAVSSIYIIPTGTLRKVRKDKKSPTAKQSRTSSSTTIKKKFMKRLQKE